MKNHGMREDFWQRLINSQHGKLSPPREPLADTPMDHSRLSHSSSPEVPGSDHRSAESVLGRNLFALPSGMQTSVLLDRKVLRGEWQEVVWGQDVKSFMCHSEFLLLMTESH